MPKQPDEDDYTPEQTAQRRDDVLKRMLATPPQPRPKLEAIRAFVAAGLHLMGDG